MIPELITYNGKTKTVKEWADEYEYAESTMRKMLISNRYDMQAVVRKINELERTGKRRKQSHGVGREEREHIILSAWKRGELTPEEVSAVTGIPQRFVYEVLPREDETE